MSSDEPTWEDVVNWLTIGAHSGLVWASGEIWQAAMDDLRQIASALRELKTQLTTQAQWAGRAAEAFLAHLTKIEEALNRIISENDGQRVSIVKGLDACQRHLNAAVGRIPVPSWLREDAPGRRTHFVNTGQLNGYPENHFYNSMPLFDGWHEEVPAFFYLRNRYVFQSALDARRELESKYGEDLARMPVGAKVDSPQLGGAAGPGSGSGRTTPPGGLGAGGLPNTGVTTPTMPTGLNTAGLNPSGLNTGGLDTGALPTSDLPDLGSGHGSGLGDLGGSGGGVGGKLAGLGGLGGGGLDPFSRAGIGPLVPPEAMAGTQGAGMAGGRIAGAGAVGGAGLGGLAGAGAMGMIPAGPGVGGMPVDSGDIGTKLVEDDQTIFGPRDRDLPGDVIG